jgi:hypothetical protein
MANSNTVFAEYNQVGPISSTETAIASVAGGTTRLLLGLTNDINGGLFDGRPFKVRAVSQGVASGACNFTQKIYWNSTSNTNLTTFTNDILILSSSTQALASKSGYIIQEAVCIWDSTLKQLVSFNAAPAGYVSIPTTGGVVLGSTAVVNAGTNPVSSTGVGTINLVQFFVTHTMSANQTSSTLVEFAIDRI